MDWQKYSQEKKEPEPRNRAERRARHKAQVAATRRKIREQNRKKQLAKRYA